jgi:hypothetical protein
MNHHLNKTIKKQSASHLKASNQAWDCPLLHLCVVVRLI